MNIELVVSMIKKNIKRAIFTVISVALCYALLLTIILVFISIKNGIEESIETKYNDYSFIIRDINIERINSIKDKNYIDKIYIRDNKTNKFEELSKNIELSNNTSDVDIYIKFNNMKNTYKYASDIIKTLNLSIQDAQNNCEFNEKLLTLYGMIGVNLDSLSLKYTATLNFSYAIDIITAMTLIFFALIFIIILYNAFLITINERKKEYAVLNSIGATEGQIINMVFAEAFLMGIAGILIGVIISWICSTTILTTINNILSDTSYKFNLIFELQYIIGAAIFTLFNVFISAIIPCIKANETSTIQKIRNNSQIKNKRIRSIFKKMPIENEVAIRNIKRSKNQYKFIITLLVICITAYISVSTYIKYENEATDLIEQYDVDAELNIPKNINYSYILENYALKYKDDIKYFTYKILGPNVLVESSEALTLNGIVTTYPNNEKSLPILVIGLNNDLYNEYLKKVGGDYGDLIIYNNIIFEKEKENEHFYEYKPAFSTNKLKFSIINILSNKGYEIIDNNNLNGNFILTDKLIEGFKEVKQEFKETPTIFIDMDTFNKIEESYNNYEKEKKESALRWYSSEKDDVHIKIKCRDIIGFSNYIEGLKTKYNINISSEYYSLKNKEHLVYVNIVNLVLNCIIITIIIISLISFLNIIEASLTERKQELKMLNSVGATTKNIYMVLVFEYLHIFVKALIIAIILSVPIIMIITKYMQKVIITSTCLIPFANIFIFVAMLFILFLVATLFTVKKQ